jgi:hypothetical protein
MPELTLSTSQGPQGAMNSATDSKSGLEYVPDLDPEGALNSFLPFKGPGFIKKFKKITLF